MALNMQLNCFKYAISLIWVLEHPLSYLKVQIWKQYIVYMIWNRQFDFISYAYIISTKIHTQSQQLIYYICIFLTYALFSKILYVLWEKTNMWS